MTPIGYIRSAQVPAGIARPGKYGPWIVEHRPYESEVLSKVVSREYQTLLRRHSVKTLLNVDDDSKAEIVMDDSFVELQRHLPIWLYASGRVLVTGLGLGCVVRGLLRNPDVERIDVVEIDSIIFDMFGAEFLEDARVYLYRADALTWEPPLPAKWDFAWHDLWVDGTCGDLAIAHATLVHRFRDRCQRQGVWGMPRPMRRLVKDITLGARRRPFHHEGSHV